MSLVFEHVEFRLVRDIQKDMFCGCLDLRLRIRVSSKIESHQYFEAIGLDVIIWEFKKRNVEDKARTFWGWARKKSW